MADFVATGYTIMKCIIFKVHCERLSVETLYCKSEETCSLKIIK